MVKKPDVAKLAKDAVNKGADISKMDPSAAASGIDDKIPEGRFRRIFHRVKTFGPPYTFEKLASSAYLSPSLHFFCRSLLVCMFVVAFFTVFKKGIILALPATVIYFLLYAALAFFTMRLKTLKRVSRITMLRESFIMGAVYQTLASIAVWMFPLAVFAAVRNQARRNPKHLILYVVHALPAGAFCMDTLVFGNAPHFRKFVLPLPILIEGILLFLATKTGKLKKPKVPELQTFWKIFIAGTVIWAVGSAFIALGVSRATNCCAKKKDEEKDIEEDIDDSEEEYKDVEMGVANEDNEDNDNNSNNRSATSEVQQGS